MNSFGSSTGAAQEVIYMGGHNVPPLVSIGLSLLDRDIPAM